jgi:nucleotide-binding universal stress UspA family protein
MERILVALDGSEHSDKALDLASDIAGKYGTELVLLHVLSSKPLTDAERYMAENEYLDDLVCSLDVPGPAGGGDQRLMTRARKHAREKRVRTVQTLLEDGDPASTILRVAKGLQVDMIFLGSRGLGDIKGLLMGSVSHKVMQLAECTCVSVK